MFPERFGNDSKTFGKCLHNVPSISLNAKDMLQNERDFFPEPNMYINKPRHCYQNASQSCQCCFPPHNASDLAPKPPCKSREDSLPHGQAKPKRQIYKPTTAHNQTHNGRTKFKA